MLNILISSRWTSNNCVFHPLRASMDWRLRSSPLLESTVLDLLNDLKNDLTGVAAEDAVTEAIEATLQALFRLSRAIRRSGIPQRLVNIASHVEYDEHGVNLTEEFRNGVKRLLEYRLKDSNASDELRVRLLDTICLRQQYFSYITARKAKNDLAQPSRQISFPTRKSISNPSFSVKSSVPINSTSARVRGRKGNTGIGKSVMSATTAPSNVAPSSQIENVSSKDEEHELFNCTADVPLPPKVPTGIKEFECPYCFLIYPANEFVGEQWMYVSGIFYSSASC